MMPKVLLLALLATPAIAAPPHPATFSIVAADPDAGEVGVAVASRFFAVGTVVPFAKAGVGAVATQSFANTTFGPRGLELLERGVSAEEVVPILTRGDAGRDQRQLGVIAADGAAATYTGPKCNSWAGGRSGPGYAVQGNILAGEPVVAAMEQAFLESKGSTLAERLYAAIVAGDAKGGDARGRQSMALLVARTKGGYGGYTDRATIPIRSSRWGGFSVSGWSTISGTAGGRRSRRSGSRKRADSKNARRRRPRGSLPCSLKCSTISR
jgi:uncharacterized Ntn-hydrolase superfamily protein